MGGLLYKVNKEVLFKISVMLAFAGFFIVASFNGKAKLFIHPKLIPMLVLCAFVFIAISLVLLKDLFKDGRKAKVNFSMLIFIPPLFMALVIPASPVTSNFHANQASQSSSKISSGTEDTIQKQEGELNNTDDMSGDTYVDENGEVNEVTKLQLKDNRIVIEDNNFIRWMDEIYNNLSKYEGKEIELTGFVFTDKSFKKDEFVAARALMACCAADTQVIGLLCRYKYAASLKKDSWYKISGKIVKDIYEDKPVPVIEIENMISTLKPKNEYLYPY